MLRTTSIDNGQDTIDSRDVIARIAYLEIGDEDDADEDDKAEPLGRGVGARWYRARSLPDGLVRGTRR